MPKKKIHDYYEGMEWPDYEHQEWPKAVKHPSGTHEVVAKDAAHEAEIRADWGVDDKSAEMEKAVQTQPIPLNPKK